MLRVKVDAEGLTVHPPVDLSFTWGCDRVRRVIKVPQPHGDISSMRGLIPNCAGSMVELRIGRVYCQGNEPLFSGQTTSEIDTYIPSSPYRL